MSNLIPIKLAEQAMAVRDEEIASLKAEVERLKGIILAQSSDFIRSKTSDDGIKPEGWNSAVAKAVDLLAEKCNEIERLRKIAQDIYVTSDFTLDGDDKDFIFQRGEYKECKSV